jgi:hypothetical protein
VSGVKKVTVDQATWSRMQREAGQLSQVRSDLPRLLNKVRAQVQKEADQQQAAFNRRQNQVESRLRGLSEQTRQHEMETSRRFTEQQARTQQAIDDSETRAQRALAKTEGRLQRSIHETETRLRSETQAAIRRQAAQFQAELAQEREERERQVSQLDSRVTQLRTESDQAQQLTRTWLADCRAMVAAIELLPHEQFAPAALTLLMTRLAQAESTAAVTSGGQMLSQAQNLLLHFSELKTEVMEREQIWNGYRLLATQSLTVVADLIDQNGTVRLVDTEGKPVERGELDVNKWTDGGLATLQAELAETQVAVTADDCDLTVDELLAIIERAAPQYRERLDELVQQAGVALFASQLRANFAEAIVDVLENDMMYHYEGSQYAEDDQRNGFFADAVHHDGSRVVVQIDPVGDDLPNAVIRVLTLDDTAETQEERNARAHALASGLGEHKGLQAAGITITNVAEAQAEDIDKQSRTRALAAKRRNEYRRAAGSR